MYHLNLNRRFTDLIARLLLVSLPMLVGCSQQPTQVVGVVTLDGEPLAAGQGVRGTVVFQPASRQGPTLNGVINRRGQFRLTAGRSQSVLPGAYLATVSAVRIEPPTAENPQPVGYRITPEKYADSAASGLRIVVEPGENRINLELNSEPPVPDDSGTESLEHEQAGETSDAVEARDD